jgi:hypothetical protein
MASVRKALKIIASGSKPRRLHPQTTSDNSPSELELVSLPNAIPRQYPPLVLIHVILLSSALFLLPTTPIPNVPLPPPARGLDKPQHPLLAPITARPVLTLAWACLGATLLIPWWAGSLRRWAHDGTLGPRTVQMRLAGDPHKQRVRSALSPPFPHLPISSTHAGHLECLRLHCIRRSGAACSNRFVRGAIHPVSLLHSTALLSSLIRTRGRRALSKVCAAHRAIRPPPLSLHSLPSCICAWSTASRTPAPLGTRQRCARTERPLGTDICGTGVSDFLLCVSPTYVAFWQCEKAT